MINYNMSKLNANQKQLKPEFLRCSKCFCENWTDIANLKNKNRTRFMCIRCRRMVLFHTCKVCGSSNWEKTKGFDPKGGQRPYYRFRCNTCNRIVIVKVS